MPALGLLDVVTSEFRILRLPSELTWPFGVTGIAASDHYIYVVRRDKPREQLVIFDRSDLTLRNCHTFQMVEEAHSMWGTDGALLVVSTGTDEVIEVKLRGAEVLAETVFWRPEPTAPRKDIHHLNAIYGWQGDLLVSGFGKKTGQ